MDVYHACSNDQASIKPTFSSPSVHQEVNNAKSNLSHNTPLGQIHPIYLTTMNQSPQNKHTMPVQNNHFFKPAISSQDATSERNPRINQQKYPASL